MFKKIFRPRVRKIEDIEKVFNENSKWFEKVDEDIVIEGIPLICLMSKKEKYLDIINMLIKKGADLNATSEYRFAEFDDEATALHVATRHGNVGIVSALLKAGANVNQETEEESGFKTPLIEACTLKGASIAGRDRPLLKNADKSKKVVKLLLEHNAKIHIQEPYPLSLQYHHQKDSA